MTISAGVTGFVAGQRELLARLERFAQTPEFQRLLIAAAPISEGDADAWLAQWLIEPAFRKGELPIDALTKPGGCKRVERHLKHIAAFLVAEGVS
ncbi:MAG: hypothetical protein ACK44A_00155 [Roseateles sp.]